ncbi:biotin-dependent carboxyltransferase family protein [Pontibacter chitinilyticus]|uniref:5-oxoprolinase subunit C family protein n=1 Tax=Pontibacter chitinilyticus TaxID=2674989 RepID=UPI00321A8B23
MPLKIESAGLLTTIQDTGRYGFQKEGMVVSGAMDRYALRIANLLVGNPESAAVLEATLVGPKIRFEEAMLIAITGADLSATVDGKPVAPWRPAYVAAGSLLAFGAPVQGSRAYVAVSGSFAVPPVMGSRATYLLGSIGGLQGRALQTGDQLLCGPTQPQVVPLLQALAAAAGQQPLLQVNWTLAPQPYLPSAERTTIRVVKGPEYDLFPDQIQSSFWQERYSVSAQSDRMGYRLQGTLLLLREPMELLSTAVTFGTIQVPPDGRPIVLMADHQTTGGYPRIAQVITADLPRLAQVGPEKEIRFENISLEGAQLLYIKQEKDIQHFKTAIQFKFSS